MIKIDIHHPISNESFLGYGERGYITNITNQILTAKEDVMLSLNTPGGSVFDGYAVLAAMDDFEGKITARVEGEAASMGAYFLGYADVAEAREFSRIMIHKAFARGLEFEEDEEKVKEIQNEVDLINTKMSNAFKNRGMDAELVDRIFAADNTKNFWFSAADALEVGLIDKVIKSDKHSAKLKIAAATDEQIQLQTQYYGFWNSQNYFYNKTGDGAMPLFTSKETEAKITAVEDDIKTLKEDVSKIANPADDEAMSQMVVSAVDAVAEELKTEATTKFDEVVARIDKLEASLTELSNTLTAAVEALDKKIEAQIAEVNAKHEALVEKLKTTNSGFDVPKPNTANSNLAAPIDELKVVRDLNEQLNKEAAERDTTARI